MLTIRINVADTSPLDGGSPLPPNAKDLVRSTGSPLQIYELDLPAGTPFGIFDPGELGLLGKSGSYLLRHCTVYSRTLAGLSPHLTGSRVAVVSPPGPGGFTNSRTIIDLGPAGFGVGSGVVPEGSGIPIPVGHKIAFVTAADAAATPTPGPHLVQMTFTPANLPGRVPGGTLRTGFPQSCSPPVIETTAPPPLAAFPADNVSQLLISVTGTNFSASDVITVRRVGPGFPDGNTLPVVPTFVDPTQFDLVIGPAVFPDDVGLYEIVIAREANELCFASIVAVIAFAPA